MPLPRLGTLVMPERAWSGAGVACRPAVMIRSTPHVLFESVTGSMINTDGEAMPPPPPRPSSTDRLEIDLPTQSNVHPPTGERSPAIKEMVSRAKRLAGQIYMLLHAKVSSTALPPREAATPLKMPFWCHRII